MLNILHQNVLLFGICAYEVCEKFVYKHSETIEYETFKKLTNLTGKKLENSED